MKHWAAPSPLVLGQAAFFMVVALSIDALVTVNRIVRRLKSEHRDLWIELGSPGTWSSFSRARADFYSQYLGKRSLTLWLSHGDYREIHDGVVSRLARRLVFDRRAVIVIAVLFVSWYAYRVNHR